MFTLKAFLPSNGTDVLTQWYAEHPARNWTKLWAQYYSQVHYLRQQPRNGWRGYYHALRDGVGGIKFQHKRIAYRHIGFFGPDANEFTFLFMAEEHNHEYLPKGCIDIAISRMKLIKVTPNLAISATIQVPHENV